MLQIKRDIRMVDRRPVGLLVLEGYVDSMDSMSLQRAIDEIYSQDVFDILLDLSRVSHVSSAGWNVLVSRLSILGERRGFFRLVGMQPVVQQVFQMIGFHRIEGLQAYANLEEAMRACGDTVQQS